MKYAAINKQGDVLAIVHASFKWEAKNLLERKDRLLFMTYLKDWKIITCWGIKHSK